MKITKLVGILVLVGSLALGGCARIALYDNAQLQGPEVGVKFYYAKPYVLVAQTGKSDKPVEISIQYLPDLSQPIYAKLNSGFGSAKLSLNFKNSILESIGQETDTKIPETIGALTNMATGIKTFLQKSNLQPYIQKLESVIAIISKQAKGKDGKIKRDANPIIESIQRAIEKLKQMDNGTIPITPPNITEAANYLKDAINNWSSIQDIGIDNDSKQLNIVKDIVKELYGSTNELQAEPQFTLYEIKSDKGTIVLKKVEMRRE